MCAPRVLTTLRRAEYAGIIGLFFLQGAALSMWIVPLSTVLEAHGLAHLRPFAYAASGVAAFVSPLLFGAMADRHASPVKVLRGLSFATALAMAAASAAIDAGASPWVVLALVQLHAFCSAPTWSIGSAIVFARLVDAQREFGPVRAMATVGWMGGCLLVSALGADRSPVAGYAGAVAWLAVAAFTFRLPAVETPKASVGLTWTQRLGYDALTLLRNRDHRVVYLTTVLFTIPLAGFYPYTPPNLEALGFAHPVGWMSLGQISEIVAMMLLGTMLVRWRLKWIIVCGLSFGVVRYVLSATGTSWGLLAGILVHGATFTFVNITAQIYLDQRVDPAWRVRAQALLALLNGGVGNMLGYLGTGAWFAACTSGGATRWSLFWAGLAVVMAAVLGFFLVAYHGRGRREGKPA